MGGKSLNLIRFQSRRTSGALWAKLHAHATLRGPRCLRQHRFCLQLWRGWRTEVPAQRRIYSVFYDVCNITQSELPL